MFVDVAQEGALDHLLGAHGRHPREHGAGFRELGVGEAAHKRGRRRGTLLVERHLLGSDDPPIAVIRGGSSALYRCASQGTLHRRTTLPFTHPRPMMRLAFINPSTPAGPRRPTRKVA